jgi:hypothetical protein
MVSVYKMIVVAGVRVRGAHEASGAGAPAAAQGEHP